MPSCAARSGACARPATTRCKASSTGPIPTRLAQTACRQILDTRSTRGASRGHAGDRGPCAAAAPRRTGFRAGGGYAEKIAPSNTRARARFVRVGAILAIWVRCDAEKAKGRRWDGFRRGCCGVRAGSAGRTRAIARLDCHCAMTNLSFEDCRLETTICIVDGEKPKIVAFPGVTALR